MHKLSAGMGYTKIGYRNTNGHRTILGIVRRPNELTNRGGV